MPAENTLTVDEVLDTARSYVGVPFKHMGRSKLDGVDCVGFLVLLGRELGAYDYDYLPYGRRGLPGRFLAKFEERLVRKPYGKVDMGDIVVLREGRYDCHCGLIASMFGELTLIHAYFKKGQVLEQNYDSLWQGATVASFYFPGMDTSWHNY